MRSTLLFLVLIVVAIANGQAPGSVDPLFNASDIGYGRGDGFLGYTYCSTIQSDGKILIGGDFVSHSGVGGGTTFTNIKRLARLNSDGTLDQSLSIGSGFNSGTVRQILLQTDGKIIALGNFTSYNGSTAVGIARLSSIGTIDPTFISGTGFTGGYPEDAVLQPDGKLVVVGTFTAYNGFPCGKIARLNANGSYDATFSTGTGFTGPAVNAIARQSDGSFVIGGDITAYNGTARSNIVRISSTGALDASYHPGGVGVDNDVFDIAIQGDGKAVVVGSFIYAGNVLKHGVVRLLTSGDVDGTFSNFSDPGIGTETNVMRVAITSTGRVLIGGWFSWVNGIARSRRQAQQQWHRGYDLRGERRRERPCAWNRLAVGWQSGDGVPQPIQRLAATRHRTCEHGRERGYRVLQWCRNIIVSRMDRAGQCHRIATRRQGFGGRLLPGL
ncbi:MAG: delta-60 repeat domain-containing protein [Flavobacteriales bacterium]|nr:delta-60 repeat domain-containing protein [Flavobacteriales bacterium]